MSDISKSSHIPKYKEVLEMPLIMAQSGKIKKIAVEKDRCKIFFYHIYHLVPEVPEHYEVDLSPETEIVINMNNMR